jgi:hypothetical protein
MRSRTLRLTKETLVELSTDELAGVAGASGLTCVNCNSQLQQCATQVQCITTALLTGTTAGSFVGC